MWWLALIFGGALLIALGVGAVISFLAKSLNSSTRLFLSSLISSLIFAPVLAIGGHGAAILPLAFSLHPKVTTFWPLTIISVPITGLIFAAVFAGLGVLFPHTAWFPRDNE